MGHAEPVPIGQRRPRAHRGRGHSEPPRSRVPYSPAPRIAPAAAPRSSEPDAAPHPAPGAAAPPAAPKLWE
eukprot:11486597-Alexandrium_andersonii.AAC.1